MIWIRADANKEIGTGHVMRCLSVATALKKLGEQVCFLVADENPVALLEARGQEYKILHSDYANPQGEIPALEALIKKERPSFLLVDSYFATAEYLRELGKHVPIGYMDDLGREKLPVDLLINYNIYADESLYAGGIPCAEDAEGQESGRPEEDGSALGECANAKPAKLCLGTAYAPLREEFTDVNYTVREQARRVLITTGGSDKYNLAGGFLRRALASRATADLEYWVVSGAYNVHLDDLKALEEAHSNVKIFCNVSNMSQLMEESDLAVTAGGSTMYELSAVGVPLVCFSFADNQKRLVETFSKKGLTCFGGDYQVQGEAVLDEVVQHIGALAADEALRKAYSERQRQVVDGQGAERIARALVEAGREQLTENG